MDSSLWDSCPVYQKKGDGRVRRRKKNFKWSAKRTAQRQRGAEIRFSTQASLSELSGGMNGTFYHEAMGVSGWEESIRYGECASSQMDAGRCWLIPNALKQHFFFLMGEEVICSFLGIMRGLDEGVGTKANQGDRKCDNDEKNQEP